VFHKDLLSTYKCQPLVKYDIQFGHGLL
jgi:hypothetical protein